MAIPNFMWLPRNMQEKIVQCSINQERVKKKAKDVTIMFTDMTKSELDSIPQMLKIKSDTIASDLKSLLNLKKDAKLMYDGVEILTEDWAIPRTSKIAILFAIPKFVTPSNEAFLKTKTKKKKGNDHHLQAIKSTTSTSTDTQKSFMARHRIWVDMKEKCYENRAMQKKQVSGASRIVLQADIDDTKKRNKRSAAKIMKGK